jgi:lipid-A-disaccharide synthase
VRRFRRLLDCAMVGPKILVSAGEASGDLYASELVQELRRQHPSAEFFGCAGPRMQAAGVRPVVDAAALSVVGLVEVVSHIPRIYGEFRKLVRAAQTERPDVAVLTDSPDFHLRVASKLRRAGVPVVYFIAPQVWAWREGRIGRMRRDIERLLCIFPFEEPYFRELGLRADYIGHPLTRIVKPSLTRAEFFRKHDLDPLRPSIALLPGSRIGEIARHMPLVADAAARLNRLVVPNLMLATPLNFTKRAGSMFFRERIHGLPIKVIEGETWDVISHADAAIAASGTVTIEAALLGTPMVTFYRVTGLSWILGRFLVRVPFYTMVNLVAGREIVPELMQKEATGERLAEETAALIQNAGSREEMKRELGTVVSMLATAEDPIKRAARIVNEYLGKRERTQHGP